MRPSRDHHLPPDPDAYRHAAHPKGRIIVIAPTRAACETIELALGLHLDTLLEREHGQEIRDLAASGRGFGIVAGTGTGKTLGIRPMAESILKEPLRVGVVNREREATPETPTWNVVIVTTGIARVVELEEQHLRSLFPEYADYARRVPRLWPRLTGHSSTHFRVEVYIRNQEYQALAGFLIGVAVLIWKAL